MVTVGLLGFLSNRRKNAAKNAALGVSRHRQGPPAANKKSRRLAALAIVVVIASLSSVGAATSRAPLATIPADPPRSSAEEPEDDALIVVDQEAAAITAADVTVVEGAKARLEVALTVQPSDTVTVSVSGAAGTSLAVSGFPLTFTAANWDTLQSATLAAGEDSDYDNDTVTLTLTATGATEYVDLSVNVDVTIYDNDRPLFTGRDNHIPLFEGRRVRVVEGADARMRVGLKARPSADVTINVTVPSDADLTVSGFPMTFTRSTWLTGQWATVTAGHDADMVDDMVTLTLTATGAAEFNAQSVNVAVTIKDDDIPAIVAPAVTVVEGADAELAVRLKVRPTADVTVTAAVPSDSDLTVSGFPLTFSPANWDTAQNVTVAAAIDADIADDMVTLTLSAAGATEYVGKSKLVVVTVTDAGVDLETLMSRFSFWENEDWDWYMDNIPFVETPDSDLDEVYYYRWQLVAMHLRYGSPLVGYVATEANDPPGYADGLGGIVAASGHQLYEMQWLRERRFAEDYISFFFNLHSSKPYRYSSWLAENVWSLNKVHRNDTYAEGLLSELVKYYEHYEEMQFNSALGLFWSTPERDGMPNSVSSKRALDSRYGGDGYRPTLNSYMYANALAIQEIAEMAGDSSLAVKYGQKAAALKTNVQRHLFSYGRAFFLHMYRRNEKDGILAETRIDRTGLHSADRKGREQIGFIPWAFNLPHDVTTYRLGWNRFDDDDYFRASYGPRTAELSDHQYGLATGHWSGPSWPFATTQSLKAMANLVQNYKQTCASGSRCPPPVTKSDYNTALQTYIDVHKRGTSDPFISTANNPDTGSWGGYNRANHSEHYFHSGFVDLVLTGLFGLQPQDGDTLVLKPLVPATWNYFLLDNLRYHGRDITIVWDSDGTKYGNGSGFWVLVDDVEVHRSDAVPDSVTINVGAPVAIPRDDLVNYAVNNTIDTYPQASASNSHASDPPSEAINGKIYYTITPNRPLDQLRHNRRHRHLQRGLRPGPPDPHRQALHLRRRRRRPGAVKVQHPILDRHRVGPTSQKPPAAPPAPPAEEPTPSSSPKSPPRVFAPCSSATTASPRE